VQVQRTLVESVDANQQVRKKLSCWHLYVSIRTRCIRLNDAYMYASIRTEGVNPLIRLHCRDDTGQHFCSPTHPELTRNRPARPVYIKLQLIFWPGPARDP